MDRISEQGLLGVFADFDALGGASLGLLAWELFVDEHEAAAAWERAVSAGWLQFAGRDLAHGEELYRLTASGWAAARELVPELRARRAPGPERG